MTRRASLLLGLGVAAFAALTTVAGIASGAPAQFLVADAAIGGTFIVAGFVGAWLRPASPAGPMLLASGGLWFVGSYAPAGHPVFMHLGFAFEKYYDLVLAALLLMLSARDNVVRPRALVWALAGAMVVRSAGRLLLQDPVRLLPECDWCQPNPFAIMSDRTVFETIEVASNVAITLLVVAVGIVAVRRLLIGGPVARRIRWPILAAGGIAMTGAAYSSFSYAWTTATTAPLVDLAEPWSELFAWLVFAVRGLVPLGFLAGALRSRSMAGPLAPFAAEVGGPRGGEGLGAALRTALGDPSLELVRPAAGGVWIHENGRESASPEPTAGRAVTHVARGEESLAAIVHDPALRDHPELLDAVVTVLRLGLENERLETALREQLRTVTESRERIVVAVEEERRRLERDLHDGAQQRLVAVMLRLQEARAAAENPASPGELSQRLDGIAEELAHATHELRELARGIHPAILTDEGLGPAVAGLARRATIPVDLHLELNGRLPPPVESTAYFTVAEALTNAHGTPRPTRRPSTCRTATTCCGSRSPTTAPAAPIPTAAPACEGWPTG